MFPWTLPKLCWKVHCLQIPPLPPDNVTMIVLPAFLLLFCWVWNLDFGLAFSPEIQKLTLGPPHLWGPRINPHGYHGQTTSSLSAVHIPCHIQTLPLKAGGITIPHPTSQRTGAHLLLVDCTHSTDTETEAQESNHLANISKPKNRTVGLCMIAGR